MSYLLFTDITEAQAYQSQVNTNLLYPEDLDSLVWVGGGIHAPKTEGQAVNYAEIIPNQTNDGWALPQQDGDTPLCITPTPTYDETGVVIDIATRVNTMQSSSNIKGGGTIKGGGVVVTGPLIVDVPDTATAVDTLPENWLPPEPEMPE